MSGDPAWGQGKGGQGGQGCPSRGEAWILCPEDHVVRGLWLLHSGPTILGSAAYSEGSVLCVSWNTQPHVWLDRGQENSFPSQYVAPLPSEQEIKFLLLLLVFSHSAVSDSATLWTAERQASLSFTVSQSLPRLMSIELMVPSNHLIFCRPLYFCPQSFLASGSFQMSWLERQIRRCCDRSLSSQNRPTFLQSLDWALGDRGYPTVSALSLKVLIVM